ncbi:hypothetical protein GP486_006195 [Trichoglossum hirsutum]|uniref:chitin synthase n=1 Tax=Trichoglossum hirsutum TaxID=265104 RepID=A0A9P8I8J8_9PEZI|nr:hypothetical protein GP486_006195 [Trichoglossum hirsutum]
MDDGAPKITDPWPVKDVSWISRLATTAECSLPFILDYLRLNNGDCDVSGIPRMVPLARSLPILLNQGLPKSRALDHPTFGGRDDGGVHRFELVTHSIGRKKRIKHVLDETSAPKVVIVMPCYKEIPEVLVKAIDSVVDCDYPPSCLHVFLSFDGAQEDELYLQTIERLGVPLSLDSYPPSIDVTYRSTRITVSRFPHGGKRHCQKRTFRLIDKIYTEYLKRNDNLFILFIDSDCILDKVCIQNFVYEMELKPGSKQNMLAMTGVITSTTEKNTLITLLQDMEYIHGQLFERSVESGCGSVTCLPGALTILRFSAFRKMAKYYFADKAEQCDDLFDYGKCHLGEDRWLTHLFMIGAKERYQIQMCTGAFCKTEAVQTYRSLLKQRRRWFLGFITNEVCMLTDVRLWKRYPILCVVRLMQNTIRTTALLFFIMVLSIITTSNKVKNLPVGFIAVSLGLNWLLMFYFGLQLRRFKAWLYPIMFIINPFFNWVYMIYGIFTAGQRTWGGPRTDAGSADNNTTVQAAIEHAEATGDDLNVVPESFKPATLAKKQKDRVGSTEMSLQPSDNLDGRFAQAEKLPGGWYNQDNDSNHTLPGVLERNPNTPHVPLHPRSSFDSFDTNTSNGNSIYLPRRVESIMGDEDRRKYMVAQSNQREAGGAYMIESREHSGSDESNYGKRAWNESFESLGSDPSPQRSRAGSNHDIAVPGPRSTSRSPTRYESRRNSATPIAVEQAHVARTRSFVAASMSPQGRSPLARLSYVRTPGSDGVAVEMAQQQELPHSQSEPAFPRRRESSGDDSLRGRSPDRRRRNRLSKTHRPGRSG